MDSLTLKGLKFHARHGFYEEERREGNNFEVDLIFHTDLSEAGRSDNLEKTVDYQEAENIVKGIMQGPSVKLIETLSVKIGDKLFEAFEQVNKLEVRVRKLNPPLSTDTQYSEVHMTWQR